MRDIKELTKDILKYAIIIIIALLLMLYVVSLQQVVGPSMNPNYYDGDLLILNKLHYRLQKPKRFEVAVINSQTEKYFIKRVIGLPGEHVAFKDNKLYIDGQLVEQKFKYEDTTDFDLKELGYDVIPEGYYFVVGDNRPESLDSRFEEIGLINKKDFVGKVAFRFWPLKRKWYKWHILSIKS